MVWNAANFSRSIVILTKEFGIDVQFFDVCDKGTGRVQ